MRCLDSTTKTKSSDEAFWQVPNLELEVICQCLLGDAFSYAVHLQMGRVLGVNFDIFRRVQHGHQAEIETTGTVRGGQVRRTKIDFDQSCLYVRLRPILLLSHLVCYSIPGTWPTIARAALSSSATWSEVTSALSLNKTA